MIPTRGGILTVATRTINHWIEVRVQDTGVGIPEEGQRVVNQILQAASSTSSTKK
jgi:signal transduction histidine kinase